MSNVFSLIPDGKPPRIIRFVDGGLMGPMLSILDDKTNVLHVNRRLYNTLDDLQKNRVQRTQAYTIHIEDRKLIETDRTTSRRLAEAAE
jgi:hypothetical protein